MKECNKLLCDLNSFRLIWTSTCFVLWVNLVSSSHLQRARFSYLLALRRSMARHPRLRVIDLDPISFALSPRSWLDIAAGRSPLESDGKLAIWQGRYLTLLNPTPYSYVVLLGCVLCCLSLLLFFYFPFPGPFDPPLPAYNQKFHAFGTPEMQIKAISIIHSPICVINSRYPWAVVSGWGGFSVPLGLNHLQVIGLLFRFDFCIIFYFQ